MERIETLLWENEPHQRATGIVLQYNLQKVSHIFVLVDTIMNLPVGKLGSVNAENFTVSFHEVNARQRATAGTRPFCVLHDVAGEVSESWLALMHQGGGSERSLARKSSDIAEGRTSDWRRVL